MRSRQLLLRAALLATALGVWAAPAQAHPLHTTFTDVRHDAVRRTVQLTIRVFADDFRAAANRFAGTSARAGQPNADSVMARYTRARVRLVLADGRTATLAWGGVRDEGETLAITLVVGGIRALEGMRIGNALMLESFGDQVNIVRAIGGGRRRSVLFTARDAGALKPLSA
jgi:uncharacterized protein (DUF2141 family)